MSTDQPVLIRQANNSFKGCLHCLFLLLQTVSTLQFFFLAMAMYPEVQKKAQVELDGVVGKDRLPSFSDRNSLTYINAMVKESMRWQMVLPLG